MRKKYSVYSVLSYTFGFMINEQMSNQTWTRRHPWKTNKPNLNQVRIWGFVSTVRDNFFLKFIYLFLCWKYPWPVSFLNLHKNLARFEKWSFSFTSLLWSPPLLGAQQHLVYFQQSTARSAAKWEAVYGLYFLHRGFSAVNVDLHL